jgi:hypothetical protein
MGRSYRQCTGCGKRALSIATRCPACGRDLEGPVLKESGGTPALGRLLTPKVVGGAIAALVVLAVVLTRGGRSSAKAAAFAGHAAGDSSEVGFSRSSAGGVGTASVAERAAERAGEILVAKTWTHVRRTRRPGGDVEAVLLPGDTVVADSLSRGWYRVALEGEVLGYAHRSTLVAPSREQEEEASVARTGTAD